MVDPLSIKCPHCSASIKIKNKSAFGKKVKCPKCETPFVIPQLDSIKSASTRKKKSKPIDLEDDLLGGEFESAADLDDDDFDDWEDDLSGGPSVKPPTKKKKAKPTPKKKSSKSSFSLSDYGFSPVITGITVFLLLSNLSLFFMQSKLLILACLLSMLVAVGCLFAGGIGLLIEAAKESGTELVLCLIVPFYNIYFGISRFESTKNAIAAFVIGVVLMTTSYLFLFSGRTFPSRHTDFAQNSAPPNIAQNIGNRPQANPSPFVNRHQEPGTRSTDIVRSNTTSKRPSEPTLPQETDSSLSPITKFDLSQVKPMPMTWPANGVFGSNVYQEKSTGSIGSVFETANTFGLQAGETPAGSIMNFRVYLPPGADPGSPVPCVLVPPAGSNLLSGMPIDSPDLIPNPEHEPYLKAGFAVVTFSIDGHLLNRENSTNLEFQRAYEQFKKSQAGLVNCLHAFLETQTVIPGIDKNNIFIAGHSSAGTLSLLFAEHIPQIKGCLAYAASVDLENNFKPHLAQIKQLLPDVEYFIKKSSPKTHISSLNCPVFLFHSQQDPVTSFADTQRFASQLKQQGTEVEFVVGHGADHYQPMIEDGFPKGIEWIKKIVAKSSNSAPDSKMAASTGNANASSPTAMSPASQINLKRHKVTFKVLGFDDFHTNAIKSNPDFWKRSLVENSQLALRDIVPGFAKGTVILDLANMTLSFELFGDFPENFSEKYANHFFGKSMQLDHQPLSMVEVANNPNSQIAEGNHLTFRVRNVNRLLFNRNNSPKIIEAHLKQIDRYVPDSLIINYDQRWAFIKLKGIGKITDMERAVMSAFLKGGLIVTAEKMNLTAADLTMNGATVASGTNASSSQPGTAPPASDTKQKYLIQYGVYSGKNAKESVQRSLKGFVWVDQASIQFNPDRKEISFNNKSAVDNGALERALTRNKFYQLKITQEALPEEKTDAEKSAPEKSKSEKTETKVGSE